MSLKILDTYLLDSLNFMRNKESKLSPYRGKSPQLNKRRLLVDWTCLSAEEISSQSLSFSTTILKLFEVIISCRAYDHNSIVTNHCSSLHLVIT